MSAEVGSKELRRKLQELTASDPAVQVNMLRYVAAFSMMVGRRASEKLREGDAEVWATFQMSEGEHDMQSVIAGRSKVDRVMLAFDVDDASGPPVNLCVIRVEGDAVATYSNCQLWAPTGARTAMIVSRAEGMAGSFSFVQGRTLRFTGELPPGNLELGFKRGWNALIKLARSDRLDNIHGGYMHVVNADGPGRLRAGSTHVSGRWQNLRRRG